MISDIKDIFFIKARILEFIKNSPHINDKEQRMQIVTALLVIIISYLKENEKNKKQMLEIVEDIYDLIGDINELDKEFFDE
jgi:hypothetical protein